MSPMKLRAYLNQGGHGSLKALSARLGVSKQSIALWASGKRMPRRDAMARILEATGGAVTVNDFYDFGEQPTANSSPEAA